MSITTVPRSDIDRVDGHAKVAGQALYAVDYQAEHAVHAVAIQATAASGTILSVDASAALAVGGVLAVISNANAPKLYPFPFNHDLHLFQSPEIHCRGQLIAAVAAESLVAAEEAARLVRFEVAERPHEVILAESKQMIVPSGVSIGSVVPAESSRGDLDAALVRSAVQIDQTYSTAAMHHNPMEPHATLAFWNDDQLIVYDTTQGSKFTQAAVAVTFGMSPENVRVVVQHVGGSFGSKIGGPWTILAALLAKVVGRPVRFAMTRQQMYAATFYRTPTISRIRLGSDADGRLRAISHDAVSQTSRVLEFAEPTASATRMMYASDACDTTHRLARLDVPSPLTMRAPGEAPGMYALESALDELACRLNVDPIELRIRNEPLLDPETQLAWSSRHLVECLREGAERFGWRERTARREGDWLIGMGVAAATYQCVLPPSSATIRREADETYTVLVAATDLGTGARTVLAQIAAEALGVAVESITLEIGDSILPPAWPAGGSAGTASWGTAIVMAAEKLRCDGLDEVTVDSTEVVAARPKLAYHSFGAQFIEAHVNAYTGEVRVPRALGVFAAGRIINPKTARSQLVGGIVWGISMALHEESLMDRRFGDYLNHDLAEYLMPTHADIGDIEVFCIEEQDEHVNPLGVKGVGEIGVVGVAAAVANAVHHATDIRVRDLPIRLDRLIDKLPVPWLG